MDDFGAHISPAKETKAILFTDKRTGSSKRKIKNPITNKKGKQEATSHHMYVLEVKTPPPKHYNKIQVSQISSLLVVDPAKHSRVSGEPPCFPEGSIIVCS